MPLPVSVKSMCTFLSSVVICMVSLPAACMASMAFLERFSMTHSIRAVLRRRTMVLSWGRIIWNSIFLGLRACRYVMVFCMIGMRSCLVSSGFAPILENLSVIVSRRCMSFFISCA